MQCPPSQRPVCCECLGMGENTLTTWSEHCPLLRGPHQLTSNMTKELFPATLHTAFQIHFMRKNKNYSLSNEQGLQKTHVWAHLPSQNSSLPLSPALLPILALSHLTLPHSLLLTVASCRSSLNVNKVSGLTGLWLCFQMMCVWLSVFLRPEAKAFHVEMAATFL